MMKVKKILAGLLGAAMVCSLAACGSSSGSSDAADDTAAAVSEEVAETEEAAEETADDAEEEADGDATEISATDLDTAIEEALANWSANSMHGWTQTFTTENPMYYDEYGWRNDDDEDTSQLTGMTSGGEIMTCDVANSRLEMWDVIDGNLTLRYTEGAGEYYTYGTFADYNENTYWRICLITCVDESEREEFLMDVTAGVASCSMTENVTASDGTAATLYQIVNGDDIFSYYVASDTNTICEVDVDYTSETYGRTQLAKTYVTGDACQPIE